MCQHSASAAISAECVGNHISCTPELVYRLHISCTPELAYRLHISCTPERANRLHISCTPELLLIAFISAVPLSLLIAFLLDLFNAAIPRFNASLEYYKLDGWVTEHVTTQLESNPIHFSSGRQVLEEDEALLGQKRVLAAFEQDPKRRAAMHKLRVSRLAHLVGALNPQVPTAGCLDHAHQAALTVHNRLPRMCAVAALIAHRRLP
eukprot:scaffold131925_cov21-Tisochrysis_lutea.AAC.2